MKKRINEIFPDRSSAHLRGILVPQVRHDLSFPYTTAAMVGLHHVDSHDDTNRAHSSNSPRIVGKSTRAEGIPGAIVALSEQRQAGRPSPPSPPQPGNRAQRQQLSLESASLEGASEDAATSTSHASQVSFPSLRSRKGEGEIIETTVLFVTKSWFTTLSRTLDLKCVPLFPPISSNRIPFQSVDIIFSYVALFRFLLLLLNE